ncbi:ABC transporter ATP-binding protein [Jiangella sp. DSM 45060]|uniref:ABC transporter ATP-binding protein n=1 Tax=Jiangella sp. DSM 45060 TaxID=1798224 RepID=UPI00087AD0EA|nr:ABC transporter ATP-binding protein [Jiangella sp. DSM 45060]SDS52069.1 putative spermidine/putrescine transport system ATP-binding protein [Jiangella sp. DSM 45060]
MFTDKSPSNDAPGAGLSLEGIAKHYGSVRAVDDVSLTIEPGQFVTLLGASGSGKTTLLRVIAGFLEPSAGRVLIDGRDVTAVPVHRRNIGMVFQSYALFPHLSVARNIAFPLAMRGMRKPERRALVTQALESVHLPGYEDRMPAQLSGGQRQRVALARAIVSRPSLLLMDEPLGALDRRLREVLQVEILKLSRELGLTVVNVTHDQEEAFTMSDRIALLADGKLVQYASPEEIYTRPVSDVAAGFLGESNLLRGVLTRTVDGRLTLPAEDGHVEVDAATAVRSEPDAGDEVVVVVRPWSVGVSRAVGGGEPDAPCWLRGRLGAVIYAGDSQKLIVERPDGSEVVVRRSMDGQFEAEPGEEVLLTWSSRDAVVTTAG